MLKLENVTLLTVHQLKLLKEKRIADKMIFYILYQGVYETGFKKIARASSSKEAWGIMLTSYKGVDRVKQIRLQTLRGEFKMLRMNNIEGVSDYIIIVQTVTNQLKRRKSL
jgi:hypothetical protein